MAKRNRRSTLDEITNAGAIKVSSGTVRKALHKAELNSRVKIFCVYPEFL
jgi:hypothetical protein